MPTSQPIRTIIQSLREHYATLKVGKESLLTLIDEAETPENIYNSNAIENSTLTLKETEKILLEMALSRNVSVRELFEAKNLDRVIAYKTGKAGKEPLSENLMLFLHQMLLNGIDDSIAGRFRQQGEYVRVSSHIAPAPEHVKLMVHQALFDYTNDMEGYFLDKIAKFHLDFETVHPFCDGNGRIGRVLINSQLLELGFPHIIIRNKEKRIYYQAFSDYREKNDTKTMERILALALTESLHKRITYLRGESVVRLSDFSKEHSLSPAAVTNAARRQTIPAFREKEVWKIGRDYRYNEKK